MIRRSMPSVRFLREGLIHEVSIYQVFLLTPLRFIVILEISIVKPDDQVCRDRDWLSFERRDVFEMTMLVTSIVS